VIFLTQQGYRDFQQTKIFKLYFFTSEGFILSGRIVRKFMTMKMILFF